MLMRGIRKAAGVALCDTRDAGSVVLRVYASLLELTAALASSAVWQHRTPFWLPALWSSGRG